MVAGLAASIYNDKLVKVILRLSANVAWKILGNNAVLFLNSILMTEGEDCS